MDRGALRQNYGGGHQCWYVLSAREILFSSLGYETIRVACFLEATYGIASIEA